MFVSLLLHTIFFCFAGYIGLFSLWRICEQEHLDEVPLFWDKIFIAAAIGFFIGKIPALFFSKEFFSIGQLLNPFSGSYAWTLGIAAFFVALYFLTRELWKDPFSLFDYGAIPLALFLSIFNVANIIDLFLHESFPFTGAVWVYLCILIIRVLGFFGLSKLLSYFENHYRTYFWYRYRRNSAQPGFVLAIFLMFFGLLSLLSIIGDFPFGIVSFAGFTLVASVLLIVSGFIVLYVRSGRLK